MTYAILCNPGHNRVYFEASLKMAISEFGIASGCPPAPDGGARCEDTGGGARREDTGGGARREDTGGSAMRVDIGGGAKREDIGGVGYIVFDAESGLTPADNEALRRLSFLFALYEVCDIGGTVYLKPISLQKDDFVDDSVSSILKYTGKTNEIFTRMLINIAYNTLLNERGGVGEPIRLLDPVAGKGTTLFEGLIRGFDVYGVEIGDKVAAESAAFLKKFLETAKYKFNYSTLKVSGANKSFSALKHTFIIAKTKEQMKNKDTKTFEMTAGNSFYANQYYKKHFFDIIAGDLPYGVQHANVTNEKQSSFTRNPEELLNACLPSWLETLRRGGVIALSWNRNVLPREKMTQIMERHGATVKNDGAYLQFAHRVDQSILRDIVVATI